MPSQNSAISAPFIVSVTGHRDIVETKTLAEAFKDKLEDMQKGAEVKPKDCILLSALAEGADTLAARVALDVGWTVIAPLPLGKQDYERDFRESKLQTPEAALKEFESILAHPKCQNFFIGYAPDCTPENTREDGEFRNRQYAYVGEFLTRHCEVLIAFWDGNDAAGMGGTGDVVHLQREGLPGSLVALRREGALLDAPEIGRTYVIWSKREKHSKAGEKFTQIAGGDKKQGEVEELKHPTVEAAIKQAATDPKLRKELDKDEAQEKKRRCKHRKEWEEFVKEAKGVKVKSVKDARDEVAKAVAAKEKSPYQDLPLDIADGSDYLAGMRDAFLRADALAQRDQGQVRGWFGWMLAIILAFTICIAGAGAFDKGAWSESLLVASWALLGGAYLVSRMQKESKRANRHQDYRALAEAWRVGFFWRALGIETPLDLCYLRSQRGELDWIRQALRTAELQWRAHGDAPTATPEAFQSVFENWINNQTEYFNKNVPANRVQLTALRNWSWAFLVLGLVASAFEALMQIKASDALGWAGLWQFATQFASANLLSSPFVPALLLISRMKDWPIATNKNTENMRTDTKSQTDKRKRLRHQFIQQNAKLTIVAIAGGLLALGAAGAILTGILPSAERVPSLQMLATLCFFLPSLIFVAADYNALPQHVKNYERMSAIFARAQKMLKQIESASFKVPYSLDFIWSGTEIQKKARRVYEELGREALHENGEWLLIHRDRPLDVEA